MCMIILMLLFFAQLHWEVNDMLFFLLLFLASGTIPQRVEYCIDMSE